MRKSMDTYFEKNFLRGSFPGIDVQWVGGYWSWGNFPRGTIQSGERMP